MDIAPIYQDIFAQARAALLRGHTPTELAEACTAAFQGAEHAWPAEGADADVPWRLLWALLIREAAVSEIALIMTPMRLEQLAAGETSLEELERDLLDGADFHPVWIEPGDDDGSPLPASWIHAANATREALASSGQDLRLLVARPLADLRGDDAQADALMADASPRLRALLDTGALEHYLSDDSPQGLLERARVLSSLGSEEAALQALQRAEAAGLAPLEAACARAQLLRDMERWEEAAALYDRALALAADPAERARVAFERGLALTGADRVEDALQSYALATQEDPAFADPWRNIAWLHMRLDRPAEALPAALRAVELEPENPSHLLNLALVHSALEDSLQALAVADRAVALYPDLPDTLLLRADLRRGAGDLEGALEDIDTLLLRDEEHTRAREQRADLLVALERWPEAYAEVNALLPLTPRSPDLLARKAQLAAQLGLRAVAIGACLASLRVAHEPSPYTEAAQALLAAFGYAGPATFPLPASPTEEAARRFLQAYPPEEISDASELLTEALEALQYDAPDAAIPVLEELVERFPDCFEGWQLLGEARASLGQHRQALAANDRALQIAPEADSLWASRSGLYAAQGDLHAALSAIDKALDRWPLGPEHHRRRGVWLAELSRPADAIDAYQRALDLQPDDVDTLYNLATLLQTTGATEAAEATFSEALAIEPADVQALLNRGSARLALGREEEAVADWDRATELEPAFPHPWFKRGLLASVQGNPWRALLELSIADLTTPEEWPFAEALQGALEDVISDLLPARTPAPAGELAAFISHLQRLGLEDAVDPLLENLRAVGVTFDAPARA